MNHQTYAFLVEFQHMNKRIARVIEAPNRDVAMRSVCGVIFLCEQLTFQLTFSKILI